MKIVYVVTRADPIGGVQIHVRDLATSLQAQGHDCTVMTGGEGMFVDMLRAAGIPTVVLRHLTVPIHPGRDLLALREIRIALKERQPELVAVHSSKAGILGRLAGRSLGIPVILTAHGWNFTPGIAAIPAAMYRLIERSAGPLASRIITVSEFDRQLAMKAGIAGERRLVTVYNGIPDVPPHLRAEPGRTPTRLVMVARFGAQKDHFTLLQALGGLRELPWELDLVGDGPLMPHIEALSASMGLANRIRFLGQRRDVDRIVAQAQVSLLVTNWEGFPLSILEAMRAGLPVVATAVGGIGESVREAETGYLVARGDSAVLRDRIGRLLAQPELRVRLGAGGRARYEQEFGLQQAVNRTLAVYEEVVADHRSSHPTAVTRRRHQAA